MMPRCGTPPGPIPPPITRVIAASAKNNAWTDTKTDVSIQW